MHCVFLLTFISFQAFSQEEETLEPGSVINTEFYDQINAIFARLELSRVPYGLLKDFALEQTDLGNYDGIYLVDSNKVDISAFNNIYQTLQSAKVNSSAYSFTPLSTLGQLNLSRRSPGKIVLSGLFFRYSQIKENAVQNGQIRIVDNQVYDIYNGGTWQNPYDVKNAFAISASTNYYEGKTQQFVLPADLWLSNDLGSVGSIAFDAGDGQGFRTILPGQPIGVNYADGGNKSIIFKITLTDQTILQSHSDIFIAPSVRDNSSLDIIPVTSAEAFQGLFGGGTMTIQYANKTLGLRKPVIIAEGFDTGHIINPDKEFGDNDYNGFQSMVKKAGNSEELNALLYGPNSEYDLVYVDWNIGTDDIHRNALLFKEIIRRVNAMKAQSGSISKNIIIGQSMGGLITRWALKDMENKGEDHQTRLFVSFDTPHQGANVPLGYQDMAIHLRKQYIRSGVGLSLELISLFSGNVTLNDKLQLAKTPAAKQMLINYVNPSYDIDNSFHNAWQAELRSMGYPQGFAGSPIRNIAVSNGTECGKMLAAAPPGSELTSIDASGNTRFLTDLIGGFFPLWAILPIATGKPAFLLEIFPGKSSITADVKIRTIAEGGGNQVYYNKVTYKKKILYLIPVSATLLHQANDAPSGMLTYDSYPGGYFDTQFNPTPEIAEQNWLVKYQINIRHQPRFSFVPAASALDIGSGANTLTDIDYKTMYRGAVPPTGSKATPFANFITAKGANEYHTIINPVNSKWLTDEIIGLNPVAEDCAIRCVANDNLEGPVDICQSGTCRLANIPTGLNIQWIATGNIRITGPSDLTEVTVVKTADAGTGKLEARLSSSCANVNIEKQINIKTLYPLFDVPANISSLNGIISVSNPQPDWQYLWTFPGQGNRIDTNPFIRFNYARGTFPSRIDLTLRVTDACGSVGYYSRTVFFENTQGTFRVYPIPVDAQLFIETNAITLPSNGMNTYTAILYTENMTEVRRATFTSRSGGNQTSINTSALPNGTYYLHIGTDKRIIIVKH